jgi:hypothetical protein
LGAACLRFQSVGKARHRAPLRKAHHRISPIPLISPPTRFIACFPKPRAQRGVLKICISCSVSPCHFERLQEVWKSAFLAAEDQLHENKSSRQSHRQPCERNSADARPERPGEAAPLSLRMDTSDTAERFVSTHDLELAKKTSRLIAALALTEALCELRRHGERASQPGKVVSSRCGKR